VARLATSAVSRSLDGPATAFGLIEDMLLEWPSGFNRTNREATMTVREIVELDAIMSDLTRDCRFRRDFCKSDERLAEPPNADEICYAILKAR
jgi:hypothetical protein